MLVLTVGLMFVERGKFESRNFISVVGLSFLDL
jgi:hypothetical protein